MRLSIQRLRWVLIVGAVALVCVLAAFIGYGRYRAVKAYRQIIARSGVSITHDSNGVTYSQSIKGKKVFTIRAKTESSLGDGKYALHNAELLLYNRYGEAADHIYGSEMEYDQNEQVARAKGEVFMDIQPPKGLAHGGQSPIQAAKQRPASAAIIHVRTSGLVYVRKLGVAATEQQVEFNYGDMTCTALGAEFDTNGNTLKLLANVHMDGLAHGKPLHVIATRADMSREANVANLTAPVVTSDNRRMSADYAVVHLRPDGSIASVQGNNRVVLTDKTQQIKANHLDAVLNAQSIPQTAKLTGDVVMVDTNPSAPTHGSAAVLDVAMDAQGQPTKVVATGAAKLSMVDLRASSSGLMRSMEGTKIVALFSPGQHKSPSHLTEIHAIGSAHASGQALASLKKGLPAESKAPALKNVQVRADDLRTSFIQTPDRKVHPERLYATGHTRLQQDAPRGEQETSSGDTLEILFAPPGPAGAPSGNEAMTILSAVQKGNVTIHSQAASKTGSTAPGSATNGTAERANYDGSSQVLTLTGHADLESEDGSIVAPTVSLNQRTQDSDASGGVQATFQNIRPTAATPMSTAAHTGSEPVTHVLAASAHFDHATRFATFYGTDAAPVRMWQDASQVQAATLRFDGVKRVFSARPDKSGGLVHAILASDASPRKPGAPVRPPSMIRVASATLDYNDVQREATFAGGVTIDGAMGEVRGQHAVAFLTAARSPVVKPFEPSSQSQPSPLNGSIDRVVIYGGVQLNQPGRHGTGEQLLYTASDANYILTGTPANPPHISDSQQGSVTGATLIFGDAGSTIVVSGEQGAPKGKGGRVHTETYVHPGDKEARQ